MTINSYSINFINYIVFFISWAFHNEFMLLAKLEKNMK